MDFRYSKIVGMTTGELKKHLKKIYGKPTLRFYFWEIVPSYGLRQMGRTEGYSTVRELKEDLEYLIGENKRRGYPMFITRAEIIKEL